MFRNATLIARNGKAYIVGFTKAGEEHSRGVWTMLMVDSTYEAAIVACGVASGKRDAMKQALTLLCSHQREAAMRAA